MSNFNNSDEDSDLENFLKFIRITASFMGLIVYFSFIYNHIS